MASTVVSGDLSSIAKKGLHSSLRDGDEVMGSPKSAVFNLQNVASPKTSIPKVLAPFARLLEENKIKVPLFGEVKLDALWAVCKKIWAWTVGVSLTLLIVVAFGFLDAFIPTEIISKETLIEVLNQIVTAGFTMMCLYVHPERCAHAHMLYRWSTMDIQKLREAYSKNATKKPHEWAHFLVIVTMLHLNCIGQYALFILNVIYTATARPPVYVLSWLAIALGCAIGAGVYKSHSPLGRDYEVAPTVSDHDLESTKRSHEV
ncbi:hypothetical protein MPTK1_6g19100 [Marchantia polymorpha subsp. ruderalis]|uniref:Uncharacterized protein n=2 Tax=Marchantia polymorpha TaxID=3197 RepID=A0AAF6BTP2_MARPO|nr:hypothetical protein MARPO_0045s0153 [Marchantia polymorpha]BBN15376.1 hypothetical protein Mp_6g19100 [Marchantia polymorpha subsp. ruderalis]|eukprot:PTQ39512.1 hypothetical protein MARPO_0045s0153 [Marchantia polymorpha]